MNRIFHYGPLLMAASLLCAAPCVLAQPAEPATVAPAAAPTDTLVAFPPVKGIRIDRAAFGILHDVGTPQARIDPTNVVRRDSSDIGWVLQISPDSSEASSQTPALRWREEFVVPTPPASWGIALAPSDVRPPFVSADRLMGTTERNAPAGTGTLSHSWKLDASDPAGPHLMRVYVQDVLVATFMFKVE